MATDEDFLKLIKQVDNNYSELPATTGFLDTGSYAFNALISGTIYGGFPDNRILGLAGEEATGKTFFAMSAIKSFTEKNPNGRVLYFDTEFALDAEFFDKRGINSKQIYILQPSTVEDFKTKCLNLLVGYEKLKDKSPLMVVLDSLGNLPSNKELEDSLSNKNVADMTKQKMIRSMFRVLIQQMGKLNVPMIVTNHVYAAIGAYVPTNVIASGGGLKYGASVIVMISKKKDKDGNDVVGNLLNVKTYKSRYSKSDQKVELRLDFKTGLDRYYGLVDIAKKYKIIKSSTKEEILSVKGDGRKNWVTLPNGAVILQDDLYDYPEKYFDKELLDKIDVVCQKEFGLGDVEQEIEDELHELDKEENVLNEGSENSQELSEQTTENISQET